MQRPKKEFVVVASRGQLLIVETPLKTTNFLLVTNHLTKVRVWRAEISL